MNAARFTSGLEVRAAAEVRAGAGRRLEGYAATFHTEARIADRFTEVLLPGCFAASLAAAEDIANGVAFLASPVSGNGKSGANR